jgi:heme/copper-type cytochrome/quinol oxidase subunit 2
MIGFHEDQDPESNRMFWVIMIAMSLVAVIFIVEVFIMFYLL